MIGSAIVLFNKDTHVLVSMSNSLLILAKPEHILKHADDFYAYKYDKYISAKYLKDTALIKNSYSVNIPRTFGYKEPLQDIINADTLRLDVASWINHNIQMPENYHGIVAEGQIRFKIIFDKSGFVSDVKFVNKLDHTLNNHLITELKKKPSVGALNNNNYTDFVEDSMTRHETKQIFTCFFHRE